MTLIAAITRLRVQPTATIGVSLVAHIVWFMAGSALGFLIPFIFTSLLSLHHDLYYLIYFAMTLGFLGIYVRATHVNLVGFFQHNWHWSLILGALVAMAVVFNVVSRGSTPGPTGGYLLFEVFWRGATYGVVDGLLLSAFPGLVALSMLKGNLEGILRKVGFLLASLMMVLVITAAYHLGYDQFREAGVGQPEIGNIIISVPMFATANPVGSILAHASMHIAATVHSYETDVFLPPQTEAP